MDKDTREFLKLYLNASEDIKALVEQILIKFAQPSEPLVEHCDKD